MDGVSVTVKAKRRILFVVHQLNYGGVQKAAIAALNAIDYSENEVTLYVRKNRTQLLKDVNKNVSKIIVNEDKTHYFRRPYAIYLTICESIGKWIKNAKIEEKAHKKLVQYIVKSQMKYEQKKYFKDTESYDVAISYIQGYTAQFVAECVNAKKKIMFYHVSGDELHELHDPAIPFLGIYPKEVKSLFQGVICTHMLFTIAKIVNPGILQRMQIKKM